MLIFLTTLLASLASIFRSRASLGLENLALRHQIGVLHRSAGKRPKLTSGDRLLWICLSRLWRDWRSALAIVKPETVVAWHRAAFRCSGPGRCGAANPADLSFRSRSEI
jgi:putative transposase